MIVIPASLRSDFIHMAGMTIHIALESTIHIVGIRNGLAAVLTDTLSDQPHQLFLGAPVAPDAERPFSSEPSIFFAYPEPRLRTEIPRTTKYDRAGRADPGVDSDPGEQRLTPRSSCRLLLECSQKRTSGESEGRTATKAFRKRGFSLA
jgi:hypothetical protein